jgi:hypothetical protein
MKRDLLLCAMAIPLTLAGCMTITPLGPMKKVFPTPDVSDTVAPEPIIQKAPRPLPPAMLVTPGEVTETNFQQVIEKLKQELEQDRRGMDAMPKTSEISVMRGR